jgi:hypothetical protein
MVKSPAGFGPKRQRWKGSVAIVWINYRSILSSGRAPDKKKTTNF